MFQRTVIRYTAAKLTSSRPAARQLSSLPFVVKPSQDELDNKLLNSRNLEKAVRYLHRDGLVVVEDVIPLEKLDRLNTTMIEDTRTLQARGEDGPFNYNQGNLQQDAPPVAEHFDTAIFANPIGTQITSALLGPRPQWTFCSGNSAVSPLPGAQAQRQPVHSDADFVHPSHPFALVINVPLVGMTPENGSTELWLGTHNFGIEAQEGAHGERASGRIREPLLEEQRQIRPPSQPVVKKGSIVVRDLRLWHAGMPNFSNDIRIMLAMIHFAPWYRNPMRLQFGEDLRCAMEKQRDLQIPIDWISVAEAKSGYLDRGFGNSYDFNQVA